MPRCRAASLRVGCTTFNPLVDGLIRSRTGIVLGCHSGLTIRRSSKPPGTTTRTAQFIRVENTSQIRGLSGGVQPRPGRQQTVVGDFTQEKA